MIAPTQIKKPKNWQDFEKLCKNLWGEIWDCADTIKRNGRIGQQQYGVDVYGIPKGETSYYGIQCKCKDDSIDSSLTQKEIDGELKKAIDFKPALKQFIIATTANKDSMIETYIRQKDIEYRKKGLFEIHLLCWEDIVDLLEERRNTYNWYTNNCQYKECTDVSVTFDGKVVVSIHPQYIRTTTAYKLKKKQMFVFDAPPLIIQPLSSINQLLKSKIDCRWCAINMKIENIGSTSIKDYKLYFGVEGDKIDKIITGIHYVNNTLISGNERAIINKRIDEEREVFESDEYDNELVFKPKENVLVQTDRKIFSFKILPKDEVAEIKLFWDFKSQNYNKTGQLLIKVEPIYDDVGETVTVETEAELKAPTITISPKIIEK